MAQVQLGVHQDSFLRIENTYGKPVSLGLERKSPYVLSREIDITLVFKLSEQFSQGTLLKYKHSGIAFIISINVLKRENLKYKEEKN